MVPSTRAPLLAHKVNIPVFARACVCVCVFAQLFFVSVCLLFVLKMGYT